MRIKNNIVLLGLVLLSLSVFTQKLYSQEDNPTTNAQNLIAPIIVTIGTGFLLQVTGVLLSVEANRHYVKASNAKIDSDLADSGSTEQASLDKQYTESRDLYQSYMYAGIGALSAGSALSITGMILAIIQQSKTSQSKTVKENQPPIKPTISLGTTNNMYFFVSSNTIGIGSRK